MCKLYFMLVINKYILQKKLRSRWMVFYLFDFRSFVRRKNFRGHHDLLKDRSGENKRLTIKLTRLATLSGTPLFEFGLLPLTCR